MATEFSALSPLPGGRGNYLTTLAASVHWVSQTPGATRDQLAQWFVQRFNASARSSSGYVRVLTQLDMIQIDALDRVEITSPGRHFLWGTSHEQSTIVAEYLLAHQRGLGELLALYAQAAEPLHIQQAADRLRPQFPEWTHLTPFQHRALWLLSLDCLEQVKGRYYQITAYGRSAIRTHLEQEGSIFGSPEVPTPVSEGTAFSNDPSVDKLVMDLADAAVDSQFPQRLQHAVARAFATLGFLVEEHGESGKTDLVVRARIGPESYSAIVDVKSRQDGKVREFSGFTLEEHRRLNQADYALLIAGDFGNGKVTRQAEQHQIVLLSVALLCDWLRLHARTPLSLTAYRTVFECVGHVKALPESVYGDARQRESWYQLLLGITSVLQEAYDLGLTHAVTSEQLYGMLVARSHSAQYTPLQIDQMLAWLAHPLIDLVVFDDHGGILPTRGWSSFHDVQRRVLPQGIRLDASSLPGSILDSRT